MLLLLAFIIFIALLNWLLGTFGIKKHTSKSLLFAVLVSLFVSICLWFSYQLTVAANLEREIIVANFITTILTNDSWWIEDLEAALQDAIIFTIYLGIMLGCAIIVETWSHKWLPSCESCGKQWTFGESLKSVRSFNKGIRCSECDETQYLSKKARNRIGLLGLVQAPFLVSVSFFENMSSIHMIIHLITMIFVYCSIYPLLLDVQSEDQKDAPMW